jgi:hypothetical protein
VTANELELATHGMLRVAAWPIETAAGFTAAGSESLRALSDECNAIDRAEAELMIEGRVLADRVHDVVPTVDDPATRRWLLAVRRQLHGGFGPLDDPPGGVVGEPDLGGGGRAPNAV